jgi:hypothetical protein
MPIDTIKITEKLILGYYLAVRSFYSNLPFLIFSRQTDPSNGCLPDIFDLPRLNKTKPEDSALVSSIDANRSRISRRVGLAEDWEIALTIR